MYEFPSTTLWLCFYFHCLTAGLYQDFYRLNLADANVDMEGERPGFFPLVPQYMASY